MKLSQDLLKWAEEHADLLGWLRKTDNDMEYGKVTIHYHQGKVVSCEVCRKMRGNLKQD